MLAAVAAAAAAAVVAAERAVAMVVAEAEAEALADPGGNPAMDSQSRGRGAIHVVCPPPRRAPQKTYFYSFFESEFGSIPKIVG